MSVKEALDSDMGVDEEPLASFGFEAEIIHWQGPPPYLFVPIPEHHVGEVRYAAPLVSYGWGMIPVEAEIDGVAFRTSLFPRDGTYLLPVRAAVQRSADLALGDRVQVLMRIDSR
jgi:Domain of unknown function (DUF1905).